MTKYDSLHIHYANLISKALDKKMKGSLEVISVLQDQDSDDDYQWMSFFMAGYVLYVNNISIESDTVELDTFKNEMTNIYYKIRELKKKFNLSSLQGVAFGDQRYDA